MTKRNRNILLICVTIIAGLYLLRSYRVAVMRAEYLRQRALQQEKKPKPIPPLSTAPPVDPPLANVSGIWSGRGVVKGRGVCSLRLELKDSDPAHYSAYSTFSCMSTESLTIPKDANMMANYLSNMNPDSAILTGTAEKGALHFHADKTIGADINGCMITDLTLTPFGGSALAAEWQEGTCQGGNLMLQKAPQMRTVRAIVAGLGTMMIISLVMIFVTLPRPRRQQISHVVRAAPCNCRGQCIGKK